MKLAHSPRWVILLLGVAAYAPALSTGFLYDDHLLIENNSKLRSWTNLSQDFSSGVFQDTSSQGVEFYRPLQTLSTRIEYSLFRLHPLPYHLTNLLIHLGNTLLLYELFLLLGWGSWVALLASSLFVTHPVIVEDLLMVSGRGELMGFFFGLSSILLLCRGGYPSLTLGLPVYGLALLSKESAMVTPAWMAAVLYAQNRKWRCYTVLIPMLLISAGYLSLRRYVLSRGLGLSTLPYPVPFFIKAFPVVLFRYVRIIIFPWDLHTDRVLPPLPAVWPLALIGFLLLSIWIFWKGPRWARFGWLWYVLTFLPKSLLMMTGSFMSDHWAYPAVPAVALPLAIVLSKAWTTSWTPSRFYGQAACVLLLFSEISWTHYQIYSRNTDEKLYRSALRYPTTITMKYNLASLLFYQERFLEALPVFESLSHEDPTNLDVKHALTATRRALQNPPTAR
jgi:hypothetical protein